MQKYPNIRNVRFPKIPLHMPLEIPQQIRKSYFGGIFLVFSGCFFRSPGVGELRMPGWYLWRIWGLGVFFSVAGSWVVNSRRHVV